MLEDRDSPNWDHYEQPAWNRAGEVPAAIRALADATDLDRHDAYHRMLCALGNDHAGTYYPVVIPALTFLREILCGPSLVARLRTLDVLIDLVGSFDPDPAYETIETADGRGSLKAIVRATSKELSRDIDRLRRSPEADEEALLASEHLERLED